jgi:coenzyme PQQ precursor peptide PqqA
MLYFVKAIRPRRENTAERPDYNGLTPTKRNTAMAWTTPTLVEICIGLEINGYLPAEF